MKTSTTVVYVVGMILLASVIMFALARKANVKAGGQIGGGSFFIEATGASK
jgi:uncharacterized membrane protein